MKTNEIIIEITENENSELSTDLNSIDENVFKPCQNRVKIK